MNEPSSTRSAIFARAVRCPFALRRATASGRASSVVSWRRVRYRARSARSPTVLIVDASVAVVSSIAPGVI